MITECELEDCDSPRYQGRYLLCCKHYKRKRKYGNPYYVKRIHGDDVARFWSYVNKTDSDWLWTGPKSKSSRPGAKYYGYLEINGKNVKAHRFSYELLVGPIPEDLPLDHVAELCNSTLCVHPSHLEPVTGEENTRRYFAQFDCCVNGHAYSEENTYIRPDNLTRQCRQCRRDRNV